MGRLDSKGTALVLACGPGRFTKFYAKNFEKVVSSDILDANLMQKSHSVANNYVICSDLNDICTNLSDWKFDYVDAQWALCFAEDLNGFIQQLKSILNPGAVIFVKENVESESPNTNPIKYGSIRPKDRYKDVFESFKEEMFEDFPMWDSVFVAAYKFEALPLKEHSQ